MLPRIYPPKKDPYIYKVMYYVVHLLINLWPGAASGVADIAAL